MQSGCRAKFPGTLFRHFVNLSQPIRQFPVSYKRRKFLQDSIAISGAPLISSDHDTIRDDIDFKSQQKAQRTKLFSLLGDLPLNHKPQPPVLLKQEKYPGYSRTSVLISMELSVCRVRCLGILTLAIDSWRFGERKGNGEMDTFKKMLWEGRTLFGTMLFRRDESARLSSFTPEADAGRVGVFGLSMRATKAW
jgi:hypothetical protein